VIRMKQARVKNVSRQIEKPKLQALGTYEYPQALVESTGLGSWGQPTFLIVPMLKMSTPAEKINNRQNRLVLGGSGTALCGRSVVAESSAD
jgi:hypothetical protein